MSDGSPGRAASPNAAIAERRGCFAISAKPPSETPSYRGWRRLLAVVALVLLPKCVLCIAGYVAMLAGLTGAASELCGGAPDSGRLAGWSSGAAATAVILGAVGIALGKRRKVSGTKRALR